jgi:hypothetical protein
VLWVDDFLIKYNKTALHEVEALFDIVRTRYDLKIDWAGKRYLGMTLQRDRKRATLTVSMPGYIDRMFKELNLPKPSTPAHSPIHPTPRTYGAAAQLEPLPPSDLPRHETEQAKRLLQRVLGKLLYYSISVDYSMLLAVNRLASQQQSPTQETMRDMHRLLAYAATYPSAKLIFRKSNMVLTIHSDASYNSEPKARSRAGGVFILGPADFSGLDAQQTSTTINAPVTVLSKRIPTVCASVSEAEYAAQYLNAHNVGEGLRQTLSDLGHPQTQPTPVIYDNEVSGKIATRQCKVRRSKTIAMRYHWIRDRIAMGHFQLIWRPGKQNLADFFTKVPPVSHHVAMTPFFVSHL